MSFDLKIEKIKRPKPEVNIVIDGVVHKKCMGSCGEFKELNNVNFLWRTDSKKWRNTCRICKNFEDTQPRVKKINYKNTDKTINNINYRICATCFNEKELNKDNFYFHSKDKFKYDCIECVAKIMSKYYDENKDDIIKKHSEYALIKYNIDSSYKLRSRISWSVRFMLTNNKANKCGESILKYLAYSIEELKTHIESQFEPWMSWNNWGPYNKKTWNDNDSSTWVWHIDHMISQSDLPYNSMEHPNFQKCWALENLRPYSAKQNVLDGNRKNNVI